MPIVGSAAGWFVGAVVIRYDLGDHIGFLLEPVDGSAPDKFEQFVAFSMSGISIPGHRA
jgi:flavin reductase (DIM6/NTAB) family NADH-FMN oxidoreductase RutF